MTSRPVPSLRVVVLPSPLLGPAAYQPLASSLVAREVPATVAPLPSSRLTPARVLEAFTGAVHDHGASHLVAHSNAGYYAPPIAASLGLPVVFMDAALPAPDVTETLLAPAAFAEFIDTLPRRDGLLPPWPLWWDRSDIAALFPDEEWLDLVTREAPRLAPAYFTTPIPVPRGWEARPTAYLAFGDTYAAELAFAQHAGWVARRESGHHLAHLADPDHVADTVTTLVDELTATVDPQAAR